MADIYPPDYTTDIGKIRALIPDVEQVDFTDTGTPEYLFADAHLAALFSVARGQESPKIMRAAASAMRAIGTSEALVSKVITTEDLVTDGSKVAAQMLAAAKQLEGAAQDEEDNDPDAFSIVDFKPRPADGLPYALRGYPQPCRCLGFCTCGGGI